MTFPDFIQDLTLAGVPLVLLVVFLVQTIREAFPRLPSRFLPLLTLAVSALLVPLTLFAGEAVRMAIGITLGVSAVASASVRYVKRDGSDKG